MTDASHEPQLIRPGALAELLVSETGDALIRQAQRLHEAGVSGANALQRLVRNAGASADPVRAAHLAWGMAELRSRATGKLGPAGQAVLFDTDGLQMASSGLTSRLHADLLVAAGAQQVVDMCAGIGVDAIAFAAAGLTVDAYECDRERFELLEANAAALGAGRIRAIHGDGLDAPCAEGEFVYLDPPRRTASSRWGNAAAAETMIRRALEWRAAGILAKLAPAADIRRWRADGAAALYVSAGGECKETLLLFGKLRETDAPDVAVIVADTGDRLNADGVGPCDFAPLEGASCLYEPDPAVIRAGLIDSLARRTGLARHHPSSPYLVGSAAVETPFATCFAVHAVMPLHRGPVQRALDMLDAGSLVVKARGAEDDPERLRAIFKLRGSRDATLIVAHEGRRKWAVIGERRYGDGR